MPDPWVVRIPQSQVDDLRAKGVWIDPSWQIVPDGPDAQLCRHAVSVDEHCSLCEAEWEWGPEA